MIGRTRIGSLKQKADCSPRVGGCDVGGCCAHTMDSFGPRGGDGGGDKVASVCGRLGSTQLRIDPCLWCGVVQKVAVLPRWKQLSEPVASAY